MKLATLLRLGGSVVLAAIIVLGATSFIVMKTHKPAHGVMVTLVKGIHQLSLKEVKMLTADDSAKLHRKPKKLPPPPAFPARKVSGIVQVTYTVQPDGSATDVHVTHAAPSGYYEKQAKAAIENSYHKPAMGDDGRLHARSASKIVHFTVPAHQSESTAPRGK